jgi:hypothetical protein
MKFDSLAKMPSVACPCSSATAPPTPWSPPGWPTDSPAPTPGPVTMTGDRRRQPTAAEMLEVGGGVIFAAAQSFLEDLAERRGSDVAASHACRSRGPTRFVPSPTRGERFQTDPDRFYAAGSWHDPSGGRVFGRGVFGSPPRGGRHDTQAVLKSGYADALRAMPWCWWRCCCRAASWRSGTRRAGDRHGLVGIRVGPPGPDRNAPPHARPLPRVRV